MPHAERPDIWWQVYPLGALGAPIREADPAVARSPDGVVHRLPRLLPWLDHAAGLGATGVLLGPIFASETHGYDTTDHGRIDPRLGDEADAVALFAAAHERDLRVMLDGVFNHVGRSHPRYRRALEEGPGSDAARLFRIDWHDGGARPAVFEGHGGLVVLDHAQAEVEAFVAGVMNRWLDVGADGWRLDAAYAIDPGFWARVLPRVHAAHPNATFVGEVIHGDYAAIVERSGVDSVTQYELWKAIWSSIHDRNLFELAWALERHNRLLERFRPMTFVGNHDVTRIASQVGEAGAAVAVAILMTLGGSPSIYAGDEFGLHGRKEQRLGGDDALREALPAGPADFGSPASGILEVHRRLIDLRRRNPWLADAPTRVITIENACMVYETGGDPVARVTIDLAGTPRAVVRIGDEEVVATAGA